MEDADAGREGEGLEGILVMEAGRSRGAGAVEVE